VDESTDQVLREIRDILKALQEQATRAIAASEARHADEGRRREEAEARAKEAMPRLKEKAEEQRQAAQVRISESLERQRAVTDLVFKQARLQRWVLGIAAGAIVVILLTLLLGQHH
jgi:hypothetical protein